MPKILVAGAGKIGVLIAFLLSESGSYDVILADINIENVSVSPKIKLIRLDVNNKTALTSLSQKEKVEAIISCLPYFCNVGVAEVCRANNLHYFDLTEDIKVSQEIKRLAQNAPSAFVPQCGLAPGFISIAANALMKDFDSIDSVLMRVGALPQYPNNALKYALNWSTEGLINQYANPCYGIVNGQVEVHQPLEGLETIEIDGLLYEAFNTSGGIGSLADCWGSQVKLMNYKTIRYPGHCDLMRFLMKDLKLAEKREVLKNILETALPRTSQDVVLIYVAVKGEKENNLTEEMFVKKIYPHTIGNKEWSAIQVTTSAGACAVIDNVLSAPGQYKGLILQEHFSLNQILTNRFGQYYQ